MTAYGAAATACVAAVALLLAAERAGSRAGVRLWKPLASSAFVAAALLHGALASGYGRLVLAALVLSLVGDVLLIARAQATFLAGLGAFLLAHVLYAAAFVVRGVAATWTAVALVVLGVAALPVARWLLPHVPREMKGPVVAYMVVITAMVALGAGQVGLEGRALVLLAAGCFYLSDLSVARDRFVAPGFSNLTWGLPLYYLAQLLFTATLDGR